MPEGFECLGYAVYCDNCGRRHALPAADTLEQAIEDAKAKGLVIVGDAQFCNEDCRRGLSAHVASIRSKRIRLHKVRETPRRTEARFVGIRNEM